MNNSFRCQRTIPIYCLTEVSKKDILYLVNFFGKLEAETTYSKIKELQKAGIAVVEDLTLALLSKNANIGFGDYIIGSIRKWLPITDGGFIASRRELPEYHKADAANDYTLYYFAAQLYVDYHRAIFLKPGTYTVLPVIYNRIVEAIVYTTSYYSYNTNQSGYNFRLYVDSNGVYQGDYSDYGSLARFDIDRFINNDGTVEYYDQWND